MADVFSAGSALRHALEFERELANAESAAGLISWTVAAEITRCCDEIVIDVEELASEAVLAGTLAIPLVRRLREALGGEAASAVHLGATSQDLSDTIMMLQASRAAELLDPMLKQVSRGLTRMARAQAQTAALGRTLMQDALPITFGLRAAQWLAGIEDARRQFEATCSRGVQLQLGGAVGTRAAMGGHGSEVADRLAKALGLQSSPPWHARRGAVAGIASALAIVVGALGKMARDVSLLAQNNIGEASEPKIAGRGGSSAMPHKQNQTSCQVSLSAALRAPALAAVIIGAMPQELERGLGGWQVEAPTLAELFMLAGASAEAMASVAEGLVINQTHIASNLGEAQLGEDTGEARAITDTLLNRYGMD